jgi:hypothetical protein
MFGLFGKNKKLLETSRQTIAKFHETIQPFPDEEIGEALNYAETVRFDMSLSETAQEAKEVFDQYFTNPFAMNEKQLHAMLDWSKSIQQQYIASGDGMKLAGLTVWSVNGLCAAHLELIPLGTSVWIELERGKNHTGIDWNEYKSCLGNFGVKSE